VRYRYVRPELVEAPVLHIVDGRHPVLDEVLADRFVPNDVALGEGEAAAAPSEAERRAGAVPGGDGTGGAVAEDGAAPDAAGVDVAEPRAAESGATLALITGPNMAGKSTYIRQAALLTLLAHTGSFVPAAEARIGLTDRIFTRIGASDELHMGQSTFMVEMTETANICHHATERSLVILDEIGRGTSTLDGLALAWAIAEHLAARRCRTLFATHYHELTQIADRMGNIANLNVTVREWADQVVFLHRIRPGRADKSYGIHVAQIAGLPKPVLRRARDVMDRLELHTDPASLGGGAGADSSDGAGADRAHDNGGQLGLFTEYVEHPAVQTLRETELDDLRPIDAFDLLRRLKEEVGEGSR
jgi:DNA mismatch repair protein MutS